jgi:hypothetical protein
MIEAFGVDADLQGVAQFTQALRIRPIEFVELDLVTGKITERRPAAAGQWDGVPVPTF